MLLAERLEAEELMDDPSLDPATYAAVLSDLSRINRLTLAYRPTLSFLRQAMRTAGRLRLLDVGFGHGDMLRQIARWCQRSGVEADLVGVDLNPNSARIAMQSTPADLPIRYLTGDYAGVDGGPFDCIVSSLVAHHMTRPELLRFLGFMDREARKGWFVNDLRRSALAKAGFPLLAACARAHPIVREDGATSIARSYREPDWCRLLGDAGIAGATLERYFPFRLCVSKLR